MSDEPRILHGRYRVDELIGRGGMADVHRGRDAVLNRVVAVKMMRPDLARDPQFQARFREEARSAAALNHPSIVAVYDTGTETLTDGYHEPVDCPYLVMEHVDGRTLREILHEESVSWRQAVEWTRGLLEALEHSHEHRIIHRDVKPANVMVTRGGAVKVMDFGIARALSDTSARTAHTQAVVGTALYLPPEQAQGRSMDVRSDLYAAGCVLFELLTGRPPFTGDTPLAIAYQHVREQPPVPSEVDPDLPPAFDAVLARALQKDPADRYPDAQTFLRDLERVAEDPTRGAAGAVPARSVAPAAAGAVAAAGATEPPRSPMAPSADALVPAHRDDAVDSPSHAVAGAAVPGAPSAAQLAAAAEVEGRRASTGQLPLVTAGASKTAPTRTVSTARPPARRAAPSGRPSRTSRRGLIVALLAFLALALVAGLALLASTRGQGSVDVPELAGLSEVDAVRTLGDAGLEADVVDTWVDDVPSGEVVGSDPVSGTSVDRGSRVEVSVSRGPADLVIPDSLRGASEATARSELEALGLTIASVEYVQSGDLEHGALDSTDPALGTPVGTGTAVTLRLSDGTMTLPSVRGMTAADARTTLKAAAPQLTLHFQGAEGSEPETGVVVMQDPVAGARVDNRSTLTLTTSATATPSAEASVAPDPSSPEAGTSVPAGGGADTGSDGDDGVDGGTDGTDTGGDTGSDAGTGADTGDGAESPADPGASDGDTGGQDEGGQDGDGEPSAEAPADPAPATSAPGDTPADPAPSQGSDPAPSDTAAPDPVESSAPAEDPGEPSADPEPESPEPTAEESESADPDPSPSDPATEDPGEEPSAEPSTDPVPSDPVDPTLPEPSIEPPPST